MIKKWFRMLKARRNRRNCSVCGNSGDRRTMHAILHGIDSMSDSWVEYIHDNCLDRNRKLGFLTEHYLGIGGKNER